MTVRDAIPRAWLDCIAAGPVGVGFDIATTDGATSNPASITVTQDTGGALFERLVLSWKTRDEAVAEAMLLTVMLDLCDVRSLVLKGLSIDASNETFFAQRMVKVIRAALSRRGRSCKFHLIKGGENITFQGQTLRAKEMLGSLYVNAHTDGILATPEGAFIKEDRRLVQKYKGQFVTLTGKGGKHGDTFDSGKHARWALLSEGAAVIEGVDLSSSGATANRFDRTAAEEDAQDSDLTLSC